MGSTPGKYRVQLDFTPEAFRELEKLKAEVGASSRADTVRRAMRVLRWAINTLEGGAQILVRRDGVLSEIEFPFLPHDRDAAAETHEHDQAREIYKEAKEIVRRGREMKEKEQFRAAYGAGRQAYKEATSEREQKDKQRE